MNCDTLISYLDAYGPLVADRARQAFEPLHVPATDAAIELDLRRPLFPSQAHTMTAMVKTLRHQKAVFCCGECGVGKTAIGICACHAHAAGRPYRAIAMVPPHLLATWQNELRSVFHPGAIDMWTLDRWDELFLFPRGKLPRPLWLIMAETTAKMGPSWRPAVAKDSRGFLRCPDCGAQVRSKKDDGDGDLLTFKDLEKSKRRCTAEVSTRVEVDGIPVVRTCGAALWQYADETGRATWAPADYIHRHMKGAFDYLVADECFPGDTKISTPLGRKSIKNIMPGDIVLSDRDGIIVHSRVVRTIKKQNPRALVVVKHSYGQFTCTPNHKIRIGANYIEASKLEIGSRLTFVKEKSNVVEHTKSIRTICFAETPQASVQSLQEVVRNKANLTCVLQQEVFSNCRWSCQRSQGVAAGSLQEQVRSVRQGNLIAIKTRSSEVLQPRMLCCNGVCAAFQAPERIHLSGMWQTVSASTSQSGLQILQQILLCHVAMEAGFHSEKNAYGDQQPESTEAIGGVSLDEEAQPESGRAGQDHRKVTWTMLVWGARRQWANHATAAQAEVDAFSGMEDGTSDYDGRPQLARSRCGPGATESQVGGRVRRGLAPHQEAAQPRSSQNEDAGCEGVDSVAFLECGDRHCAACGTFANPSLSESAVVSIEAITTSEEFVYDLEVEDTHCYFADGILVSNCHQLKADDSARANALGALIASCRKVIAMTGTLIGGKASHVRSLLFRMAAKSLRAEDLAWTDSMEFSRRYGRVDTIITEKESGNDNRRSRGKTRTRREAEQPGIMPTLYGRHLIGNTVFLSLEDVAADLPPYSEHPTAVELGPVLSGPYREVEEKLKAAVKNLLRKGNKQLLSPMLHCLLAYSDYPYDWPLIGYVDRKDVPNGRFVPVVSPPTLDKNIIWPKERKLLEILAAEKAQSRQCWVFACYTDKHDVLGRLETIVRQAGFRVKVLRAEQVPTKGRSAWIAKHAPGVDVMISHPQPVGTGMTLFSPDGRHNFPSLVFYETGYDLFALRQASRRSYRIGQKLPCHVHFLYYAETMQARAMALMAKKLDASLALEGQFSVDGLAAMCADGGSLAMELAKSLVENIDFGEVERVWQKCGQEPVVKPNLDIVIDTLAAVRERPLSALEQLVLFGT